MTAPKPNSGAPVTLPVCSGCGEELARVEKGSLKIPVRSRLVAVRLQDGVANINCPRCGASTDLPLKWEWWRGE